jgi:regulator of sirC expression with transglutaminase-like and TPR domain
MSRDTTVGVRLHELLARSPVRLAEAALLVAQIDNPTLNTERYLDVISKMALNVRNRAVRAPSSLERLAILTDELHTMVGLRINREDHYDPRNSLLNDVLDRRLGLPITLAIVYLDVASQLDLPLQGVAFPGHIFLRLDVD